MEEGRLASRLLGEIGSARAAIAASYLSLWRSNGTLDEEHQAEPSPPIDLEQTPHAASAGQLPETEQT
jgi:hypothetical protein